MSFDEINTDVGTSVVSFFIETISDSGGKSMFIRTIHINSIMAILCFAVSCLIGINTAYAAQPSAEQPQINLLKVGDKINVLVEGEDDLSGFYTVNKAGMINIPLIGNILVAGKTTHEAKILITQKLQNGYLRQPDVSVKEKPQDKKPEAPAKKPLETIPETIEVKPPAHKPVESAHLDNNKPPEHKESMTKQVYIVGGVNNPGYYALSPKAGHILNIIALAGGYTKKADTENFEIVRNIGGVYYRKQAQTGALEYHDGDIVVIEEH